MRCKGFGLLRPQRGAHLIEQPDLGGERAGDRVLLEHDVAQLRHVGEERRGQRPVERVLAQVEELELVELAERRRHLMLELVVGEVEDAQVDEVAELGGDGARERVVPDVQVVHLHLHPLGARVVDVAAGRVRRAVCVQRAELRRERAGEVVVVEVDGLHVVDQADLRRDRPADLVPREVEVRQVGQVAELRVRQVAAQPVPVQIERGDAPGEAALPGAAQLGEHVRLRPPPHDVVQVPLARVVEADTEPLFLDRTRVVRLVLGGRAGGDVPVLVVGPVGPWWRRWSWRGAGWACVAGELWGRPVFGAEIGAPSSAS